VQEVYTKGGMSGKLRKGHNRQGLRKNVKWNEPEKGKIKQRGMCNEIQ
jgi:hypothetical protein